MTGSQPQVFASGLALRASATCAGHSAISRLARSDSSFVGSDLADGGGCFDDQPPAELNLGRHVAEEGRPTPERIGSW